MALFEAGTTVYYAYAYDGEIEIIIDSAVIQTTGKAMYVFKDGQKIYGNQKCKHDTLELSDSADGAIELFRKRSEAKIELLQKEIEITKKVLENCIKFIA